MTIGEAAFANMSSLTRLALRDNNLTEVPANLYSNLESLELLYLYNNQISSIDVAAFAELPKLTTLRLYNNNISELALGVFDGLNASEIDLSGNNLDTLPLNLLANHSDPSSITTFNIDGNPLTTDDGNPAFDVNGWEITDTSWVNVGVVNEYSLRIGHALPEDLTVSYSLLNGSLTSDDNADGDSDNTTGQVTISAGSTTSTDTVSVTPHVANTPAYSLTSALTQVAALSGHIDSTSLSITNVMDDTFCLAGGADTTFADSIAKKIIGDGADCNYLSSSVLADISDTLDLSSQSIESVPALVSQSLTAVEVLRLNANTLASLPSEAFVNLTVLEELRLDDNAIASIGTDAFANTSSLQVLNLHNNSLNEIAAGLYSNHPNLEQLYLSANNAPSIAAVAFANLTSLKSLHLQDQAITGGLPSVVFAGLTSLEELYLENTSISTLDEDVFSDLSALKTLHLQDNDLSSLEVGVFSSLTGIEELRLASNQLTSLPAGLFANLSVTTLDVSNNDLTDVPLNLLADHADPSSIELFNITGNPAADGDGWQITDVNWQNSGLATEYRLSIGHALPSDLTVRFTVTDGTVSGSTTGTVTIAKGDTSSNVITVSPDTSKTSYSLISDLASFTDWSGHIASSSVVTQIDNTFCQGVGDNADDTTLTDAVLEVVGGDDCLDLSTASLQGLTGELALDGMAIQEINPVITQALVGLDVLRLNNNTLTQIPESAFANLTNLTELHLNENAIVSIAANAFEGLSSLELLDLNNNNIDSLPVGVFSDLTVTQIDLSNNDLDGFTFELVSQSRRSFEYNDL